MASSNNASKHINPLDKQILHDLSGLLAGKIEPQEIEASRWDELTSNAIRHGVAPLLFDRFRNEAAIPSYIMAKLHAIARANTMHSMAIEQSILEINDVLTRNGIKPLWLKGANLSFSLYDTPAHRVMMDIDFLVPFEAIERVLALLFEQGYVLDERQRQGLRRKYPQFYGHHFILTGGLHQRIRIEVHFRMLGEPWNAILPSDYELRFLKNVRQIEIRPNVIINTLSNEYSLLLLVAHDIFHHELREMVTDDQVNVRLQRKLDVYLMLQKYDFDWNEVVKTAIELDWYYALYMSLLFAKEYFDATFPASILSQLRDAGGDQLPKSIADSLEPSPNRLAELWKRSVDHPLRVRLALIMDAIWPDTQTVRRSFDTTTDKNITYYYLQLWYQRFRRLFLPKSPK